MSNELQLGNKLYNPDVLSCLANLSNDEVFTPPQLANKVLDLLPEEIWHHIPRSIHQDWRILARDY